MRVVLTATAVALFLSATSSSTSVAQDNPVSWRTPPTATEDDFPPLAVLLGIDGMVTVECSATEQGVPEACAARSESPTGLGFGDRAIEIIQRGRLNPTVHDNADRATFRVRVPFMAQRPSELTRPVWTGPNPSPEAMAVAQELAKGVVAASPMPFMPEIDAPPDRRDLIEEWFREEMPSPEQMQDILATLFARTLSIQDMKAMTQGRPPSMMMPNEDQMGESMVDLFDPLAAAAKVRTRYCARFDCEIIPPSPVD